MLKRKLKPKHWQRQGYITCHYCLCNALLFWAWLKLKKPYKYFSMDGINKVIFEEAVKSSLLNNLNKHHL